MALSFNRKITKKAFGAKLIYQFGLGGLKQTHHQDMVHGKIITMTLYHKDGVHVGSWQSGDGWIF